MALYLEQWERTGNRTVINMNPMLASPPADWRRQLGRPHITWLSTVQQDLKQHHLTLPDAADLAQNRPLWRMMSTYNDDKYTTFVVLKFFTSTPKSSLSGLSYYLILGTTRGTAERSMKNRRTRTHTSCILV